MSVEERVYGVLINLLGDTNLSINIDSNLELFYKYETFSEKRYTAKPSFSPN